MWNYSLLQNLFRVVYRLAFGLMWVGCADGELEFILIWWFSAFKNSRHLQWFSEFSMVFSLSCAESDSVQILKWMDKSRIGWVLNVRWVSSPVGSHSISVTDEESGDGKCSSFWSIFMLKYPTPTTLSLTFIKFSARGRPSFSSKVGLTMIVKWINDAIMAVDTRLMLYCGSINGSHMEFSRNQVDFHVDI